MTEPTVEENADKAAQERSAELARCARERAEIKAVQQKRWDARRDELTKLGELKPGETLEQYDDRMAGNG
jgi:hypothetical protein